MRGQPSATPPLQVLFEPTAEIFATDSGGSFSFPLVTSGQTALETGDYDEVRFVFSVWHPSNQRAIDLDRAYLELRASFDPEREHYTRIAEIEPVVAAYGGGDTFDGWLVLPVLGRLSAFTLFGSGFEPRARLQIRASAYFVA